MFDAGTLSVKLRLDASGFEANLAAAAKSAERFGSNLQRLGGKLTLGVTTPLAGIGVAALKSAGDFEQSMNLLRVVTSASADEMQALQARALELGQVTSFSAGEAAQAMLELGKAGLSPQQVLSSIAAVLDLAAAGGLSLAQSAEIVANSMQAFGLSAEETGRVTNLLAAAANASSLDVQDLADSFKMSSAVFAASNQSIETLTTALAILANRGLKGSDAGTSLKTMLMRLTAPTDAAKDKLDELGISVFDASGAMRALPDILADMQQAFFGVNEVTVTTNTLTAEQAARLKQLQRTISSTQKKIADYQSGVLGANQSEEKRNKTLQELNEKLAAAQREYNALIETGVKTQTVMRQMTDEERQAALATIFGADAVRAATILLSSGVEGWNQMAQALDNGSAAADLANARMSGLNGAIEYFKGSIDSFLISTALPFLDSFSGIIRAVADAITAFGALPPPVKNAALAFAALAAAAGPTLVAIGGALKLAAPALSAFGAIVAAVTSPIGLLVAALAALGVAVYFNVGGVRDLLAPAFDFVKEKATALAAALEALGVVQPFQNLLAELAAFGQKVLEIAQDVANGKLTIEQAFAALTEAFAAPLAALDEFAASAQAAMQALAVDAFVALNEQLTTLAAALREPEQLLNSFVSTLKEGVAGVDPELFAGVQENLAALKEQAVALLPAATAVPSALKRWSDQAPELAAALAELGAAASGLGARLKEFGVAFGEAIAPGVWVVANASVALFSSTLAALPDVALGAINALTALVRGAEEVAARLTAALTALRSGDWRAALDELSAAAVSAVEAAKQAIQAAFDGMANAISAAGATFAEGLRAIGLPSVAETLERIAGALSEALRAMATMTLPSVVLRLLDFTWPSFPPAPDWLVQLTSFTWPSFPPAPGWLTGLLNFRWPSPPPAPEWLNKLFGGGEAPAIPFLGGKPPQGAVGRVAFAGGSILVGEFGPELVTLPRGSRIDPAPLTRRLLEAEERVTINVSAQVSNELDMHMLARRIARELQMMRA